MFLEMGAFYLFSFYSFFFHESGPFIKKQVLKKNI